MNRKDRLLIAAVFLILNAAGLWKGLQMYERSLRNELAEPKLTVLPGKGTALSESVPLLWRWDQPVAAEEAVGREAAVAPVTLDPPVSGRFVWSNDRTLTFHPARAWPAGRPVHARLDTVLRNLQGRSIHVTHETVFDAPPLQWLAARVQSFDPSGEMIFTMRFNQAVDVEAVREHMELRDHRGGALRFHLRETPVPGEIHVTAAIGEGAPLQVFLQPGLSTVYGPHGALRTRQSRTLEAPTAFALVSMTATMPNFAPGWIDLTFTTPPDLRGLREHIQIEPAVSFSVGEAEWWNRNRVRVRGDFQPGERYRVRLSSSLSGVNGHALGRDAAQSLLLPDRQPGVQFTHSGTVLNAAGSRRVQIETVNESRVTVELHRIHDNNLLTWLIRDLGADGWQAQSNPDLNLGESLWKAEIPVENGLHTLELAEVLNGVGQGAYRLRVRGKASGQDVNRVLLLGEIGLLTRRHDREVLVWAVGLGDALPAAETTVQLWSVTRQLLAEGQTDANGLARLQLPPGDSEPLLLLARRGEALGVVSLRNSRAFPAANAGRPYLQDANEAFLYSDRGMYRPGETVRLRGIVRGPGFRLPGNFPVQLRLHAPDGNVLRREMHTLSELGTLQSDVVLEEEWPNGPYRFSLALPGEDAREWGSTTVHLESFVPPQIVVELDSPALPQHVRADFMLGVYARLLYGSPAAGHEVQSVLSVTPELFRSSEHPAHRFSDVRKRGFSRHTAKPLRHVTGVDGRVAFPISVPEHLEAPSALRATVNVTVTEFSGRPASAVLTRRVDPAPHYLGVKVSPLDDAEAELDIVRVAAESGAVEGDDEVTVTWYRRVWTRGYRRDSEGRFTYVSEAHDEKEGEVTLRLTEGHGTVRIRPGVPGNWRVAVEAAGSASAAVDFGLGHWVAQPERADRVELSLDRERYAAGDLATLRVHTPFAGKALLTVETDQVWVRQVLDLPEGASVLPVVVPNPGAANAWVRVSVIRPQPGGGAAPVMLAEGAVALPLDWSGYDRPLSVEAPEEQKPATPVRVILRGEPGAEVTLAGVDEGILRLNDFATPDPYAYFASLRRYGALQWDLFDILLPELGELLRAGDAEMGGDVAGMLRNRMNPVDAKRFRPLAWFSGTLLFPESGELTVEAALPEFTGEVRWMAVQAGRAGVGSAQANTRLAREVVVQQSLPLFLAPGDYTVWRIRLHNRAAEEKTIRLTLHSEGPAKARDEEVSVTLEAGEVKLWEMDVFASEDVGVSRFGLELELDGERWSEEIELAVRPVHAYRAESRTHLLQPGESLRLEAMEGVYAQTARRELRVSALPTLELTGAVDYLIRYPYGCLEQTTSTSYALLRVPELHEGAREMAQSGVLRLAGMQNRNGSFGYWSGSSTESVEAGLYALEFWLDARAEGLEVDAGRLQAGLDWTRRFLTQSAWSLTHAQINRNRAHAALVLAKAGQLDRGWAQRLRERRGDLDEGARLLAAEALVELGERPAAAEMLTGVQAVKAENWGWYSDVSHHAHLLRVLCRINPADPRIPRLVELLQQMRNGGRWGQTFENAASVRAVAAYRDLFAVTGGEVKVVLEGEAFAAGETHLLQMGDTPALRNDGETPVFVSELRGGAPKEAPEMNNAFLISSEILTVNGGAARHPNDPHTPWVTTGENVLLKVTLEGLPGTVSDLAIDLRLPAGLEALPLRAQRRIKELVPYVPAHNSLNGTHVEIRDDRILLFPGATRSHKREFFLLLRGVSLGLFEFPAPYAQAMYDEAFEAVGDAFKIEVGE